MFPLNTDHNPLNVCFAYTGSPWNHYIMCLVLNSSIIQLLFSSKSFQPCTESYCKYLVSVSSCPYTTDISAGTPLRTGTPCIFLLLYTADEHSSAPATRVHWNVTSHQRFQGTKACLTRFLSLVNCLSPPSGYFTEWQELTFNFFYLILT